jgi:Trk K+ transport system NAD-binding subunit
VLKDWQRRTALAIAISVTVVVSYAFVYRWGMGRFEARPISFLQAVQVVVETLTTSGFGGHAPWSSDQMNLMVLAMNVTGVVMVFLALPYFAFPLLKEMFGTTPPRRVELEGHVILCPYNPRIEAMMRELRDRGRPYAVIEPDADVARRLAASGYPVIQGDPEHVESFERASISLAVAVVVDATDEVTTSIVLAIREAHPSIRVVTVVDDDDLEAYHLLAGADRVLSPRRLLGQSLARQTPFLLPLTDDPGSEIGSDLELAEVVVEPGGPLVGQTVGELRFRETHGVEIIGAWVEGGFQAPIDAGFLLRERTRLLVAGLHERVHGFFKSITGTPRSALRRNVLIVGYGRSGRAAAHALAGSNVRLSVIDVRAQDGVDVVGDARDPAVYEAAGIGEANAIIVDLDDDTVATFATLITRKANPGAYIIAGANADENVRKLYRAGADYVQSLAAVTARMMAATVFADEEVLALEDRIAVVRLGVGRLAGRTLADGKVRTVTGSTVLGVVRDGTPVQPAHPTRFVFQEGDRVIIAGLDEAIRRFETTFLD